MKQLIFTTCLAVAFFSANAQWDSLGMPSQHYPLSVLQSANGKLYVSGNAGIFESSDNGVNWTELTASFQSSANGNTRFFVHGDVLYVGSTGSSVYRSTDGGSTWEMDTVGLPAGEIRAMYFDGTRVVVGLNWFDYGVYYKDVTDNSWTEATGGNLGSNTSIVDGFTKAGSDYYAVASDGFYKSTDNCATWTLVSSTTYPGGAGHYAGNTLISINGDLYYGAGNGVHTSADGGASWTRLDSGFPVTFGAVTVSAIHYDGANLFVGLRHEYVSYKSSDLGQTWTELDSSGFKVSSLVVHGSDLYAVGFNNQVVHKYGGIGNPGNPSGTGDEMGGDAFSPRAYPNPFNDRVWLSAHSVGSRWSLCNLTGQVVLSGKTSSAVESLDLSTLDSGVYLLQMDGAVTKLIKE